MDYLKFLEELDTYNEWASEEDEKWFKDLEDEVQSNTEAMSDNLGFYPKYPIQGPLGLSFYVNKEDKVDRVNHPAHYTGGGQEAIITIEDAIIDAPNPVMGSLQANVLKYLLRVWRKDNALEDLKKSRWYLNRLIDKLEGSATFEK